jgi:hypothetical protein
VRALLQSGAAPLEGAVAAQTGAGLIQIDRSLDAEAARNATTERTPSAEHSRLVLASSFLRPDPETQLEGLLLLRDRDDRVASGFDRERLDILVEGADFEVSPSEETPGLWRFMLRGQNKSGGRDVTLRVHFDGEAIATTHLPIALDNANAGRSALVRGGCAVCITGASSRRTSMGASFVALVMFLWAFRRETPRK